MAFCRKCGTQLDDHARFCAKCGASQEQTFVQPTYSYQHPEQRGEGGPWKVFAIVGFVLGLVGFIFSFAFGSGLFFSIPGLVLSILGKRSASKHGMAVTGMVFSIIGLAIGCILMVYCMTTCMTYDSYYDPYYYYTLFVR